MERIGVIGFGFSGLMVVANAIRMASKPCEIYVIDDSNGWGAAYTTSNTEHLLNVRAQGMSAFTDAPMHLVEWLASDEGKRAAHSARVQGNYAPNDFIPRPLYGLYLSAIWRHTQEIAAQKNMVIKLVPSRAVAIQSGDVPAILTARGDAIAVDRIVLATGHEPTPILTHIQSPFVIQNPWAADAFVGAEHWHAPVVLIGTGLTAIDVMLSLRKAGYAGDVMMVSRRGWVPKTHADILPEIRITAEEIAAHKTLQQLVHLLRTKIHVVGDWRAVVDALRPHTHTVWQRFTTREQRRFLALIAPLWNIHRHRMAPEIAARIEAQMASGGLHVMGNRRMEVTEEQGQLSVLLHRDRAPLHLRPSRIINCTGLSLNLARSGNPLLRQLLADGMIEPHANGLGMTADQHLRAWGRLHPNLYAMGSLLTGQLLESTAVPELRTQAATIAKQFV